MIVSRAMSGHSSFIAREISDRVTHPHRARKSPRGAAWNARHPVTVETWVQIPSRTLVWHGTQSGKAAKLKPSCSVGSTPTRVTETLCVGWALACPSGCNPPASCSAGSIPAQRTDTTRKAAGYGWPGRIANACLFPEIRVRFPCLPLISLLNHSTTVCDFASRQNGRPAS